MWGVIFCHIDENKMLSKTIKYHPIVVGAYAKWLVSNSSRKEAIYAKTLAVKLKEHIDELSAASYSTTKRISDLKTRVVATKKAIDQTASKVSTLKKLHYSADVGVQGGCAPDWRSVSEES